jgi:hypothetical protein
MTGRERMLGERLRRRMRKVWTRRLAALLHQRKQAHGSRAPFGGRWVLYTAPLHMVLGDRSKSEASATVPRFLCGVFTTLHPATHFSPSHTVVPKRFTPQFLHV